MSGFTDENLYDRPIFHPLITGFVSPDPAVRLAAVHHAFRYMDRAAATGTEYGVSIAQALCDIVVLHLRAEPDLVNIKFGGSNQAISQTIMQLFGKRLKRASEVDPMVFSGNAIPSNHFYGSPLSDNKKDLPEISLMMGRIKANGLKLSDCSFSGSNFSEASFSFSEFNECDLSYCCFSGSQLDDAIISGNVSNSLLSDSNLTFSKITAVANGIRCNNADLNDSNCVFYDAADSSFYCTNFQRANLEGSDMNINLDGAIIDYNTVLPDGSQLDRGPSNESRVISTRWGDLELHPDSYIR